MIPLRLVAVVFFVLFVLHVTEQQHGARRTENSPGSTFGSSPESTEIVFQPQREQLECAPDYHSCGSVPAPTSSLPCCNAQSYCYRRPPYFSQCRPKKELSPHKKSSMHFHMLSRMPDRVPSHMVTQAPTPCAQPFFLNCSATLPCCNLQHVCYSFSTRFSICIPRNI